MNFDRLTDEEILNIANPLMDNLMDGSSERNHQKPTRDFTERLKAIVTEDNFLEQWKGNKIGEFSKREFLLLYFYLYTSIPIFLYFYFYISIFL